MYCYTQTAICYSITPLLKHHRTFCQRLLCKNTQEPSFLLNWNRELGYLKGLKNAVQMLNFVVFHLFPVLNVLANDIWVTSGDWGNPGTQCWQCCQDQACCHEPWCQIAEMKCSLSDHRHNRLWRLFLLGGVKVLAMWYYMTSPAMKFTVARD